MQNTFPWLSLSIWIPIFFGVLILGLGRDRAAPLVRMLALVGSLLGLLVTLPLYTGFDAGKVGMQFVEDVLWIGRLNAHYRLGIDGISVWFILLTAFINVLVVLAGWEVIEEKQSKNKVSKPFVKSSDNGLDKHMENFMGVVRNRKIEDLHCSIQAGAHVATVAQMGNISMRSGQRLAWDAKAGKFDEEKINQQYLVKEYHNGYKLPMV